MKKLQSWVNTGMVPIVAMGAVAVLSTPSKAENRLQVSCQANSPTPTVIVTLSKEGTPENYPILNFLPQYFSRAEAVQNCQNAAQGLQTVYNADNSMYLTSDKINDRSVVCAVERRGIGCNHYSAQILFDFTAKTNPSQALYEMLGNDFKQAQRSNMRTVGRTYTATKLRWWPF